MNSIYIKGLLKNPNRNPKVVYMENNLANMRSMVNGEIDVFTYKDVLLVCRKQNRTDNLEPSIEFDKSLICGSILIFSNDVENGDFVSLSTKQVKKYMKEFSKQNSLISERDVLEAKKAAWEYEIDKELD